MPSKDSPTKDSPHPKPSSSSLNAGDRTVSRSISSSSMAGPSYSTRPSRVRIVATKPPWSQEESVSSDDEPTLEHKHNLTVNPPHFPSTASHVTSVEPIPNWWTFSSKNRPWRKDLLPSRINGEGASSSRPSGEPRGRQWSSRLGQQETADQEIQDETLRLELPPPPPAAPYTIAQVQTPGWDTPWSPSGPKYSGTTQQIPRQLHKEASFYTNQDASSNRPGTSSSRKSKRKAFRKFILNNTYVPLLFRVMNLAFTTSALAVAVRIRRIEMNFEVTGAVGSSPNLVIIFAPLTLVHVIWAIYLEYWGRPLGLWRTSTKLGYTLSETLFICAWSAALSLCFDNIFTSPLQCTPISSTKWFSSLPPQLNPLTHQIGRSNDRPTDQICDSQAALIALVTVGLFSYCANLVISLFRIFEKVKYHTHSLRDP